MILAKHFHEPMEVSGKRIKIWKELPKEVIHERKNYKKLIDKLNLEKIHYRWDLSQGVCFFIYISKN